MRLERLDVRDDLHKMIVGDPEGTFRQECRVGVCSAIACPRKSVCWRSGEYSARVSSTMSRSICTRYSSSSQWLQLFCQRSTGTSLGWRLVRICPMRVSKADIHELLTHLNPLGPPSYRQYVSTAQMAQNSLQNRR
jgi:hypothetical protein